MPVAENDIEQIEHLDFEFTPPCERLQGECDRPAAWKVMLGCCGRFFVMCDICLTQQQEFFSVHPDMMGTCLSCYQPIQAALQIVVVGKL